MRNLIPLSKRTISDQQEPTVSARKLYEFLEVRRDFSNWIRSRIKQYQFEENQDFVLVRQNGRTKKRGGDTRSKEYYLTLDMAKELAMVERNQKGREARQYFIECERKLRDQATRQLAPRPQITRVLVTMEDGQVIDSTPVPEDAVVVSRQDLSDINRPFFAIKAAMEASEKAWANITNHPDLKFMGLAD